MPFSRSRSPESMTRSTTAWFERNAPVWRSIASTSVVLPWSTWATMATLRRSSRVRVRRSSASWAGRCGAIRSPWRAGAPEPRGGRLSHGTPASIEADDRRRRDPVRDRRGRARRQLGRWRRRVALGLLGRGARVGWSSRRRWLRRSRSRSLPEATAALSSTAAPTRGGSDGRLTYTPTAADRRRSAWSCIRAARSRRPPMRPRRGPSPSAASSCRSARCRSTSPSSTRRGAGGHRRPPGDRSWAVGGHSLGGAAAAAVRRRPQRRRRRARALGGLPSADLDDDGVLVASHRRHARRRRPVVHRRRQPGQLGPAADDDRHRRRQPRADGLVHGPAERPAGDDQPRGAAGRRSWPRRSSCSQAAGRADG